MSVLIPGVNDLVTKRPDLLSEWDYEKNGDLRPDMVAAGSHKKVWWKCSHCGHEWASTVSSRTAGHGCPRCWSEHHTSFAEQSIFFYVSKYFPDAINRDVSMGKELDVYIPSLHVGIEYDGVRYHHNIKRDIQKCDWCKVHAIRLIRVREEGCPNLPDNTDVLIRCGQSLKSLDLVICELLKLLGVAVYDVSVGRDQPEILNVYMLQIKKNSLTEACPDLVLEWHPEKNGSLTPDKFSLGSKKCVWWLGKCGHEWIAAINNRVNGKNCPYCAGQKVLPGFNDFASSGLPYVSEWDYEKNVDVRSDQIVIKSKKPVWWRCKHGHSYQMSLGYRFCGHGCPYCSGRFAIPGKTDLVTLRPDIAMLWDYDENEDMLPENVSVHSGYNAWWHCEHGHKWQMPVSYATSYKSSACPYCSGRKRMVGVNDFATLEPDLAKEWNYEKNGDLKPSMVSAYYHTRVWWKCAYGHEWQLSVRDRCKSRDCPYCAGRKVIVGQDDLATLFPDLANEWDHEKNGTITPDSVSCRSRKLVYWCGLCGHKWGTRVIDRVNGSVCPVCERLAMSKVKVAKRVVAKKVHVGCGDSKDRKQPVKKSPSKTSLAMQRIGMQATMRNGDIATVIDYKGNQHVTVQFEDGSTVDRSWSAFEHGTIRNPNHNKNKYVGMTCRMKNGLFATVIDYITFNNIVIRFENGDVVEHVYLNNFLHGEVTSANSPSMDSYKAPRKHVAEIGETVRLKGGFSAEIIAYHGTNDIDVKLNNGLILYHKMYTNFKRGELASWQEKHLYEQRVMDNGLVYKIIGYNDDRPQSSRLRVECENGVIRNTSYRLFKSGKVR